MHVYHCFTCGKEFKRIYKGKVPKRNFCTFECMSVCYKQDPEIIALCRKNSKIGAAIIAKINRGQPKSELCKQRISATKKGAPLTEKQKQQLEQLHESTRGEKNYRSIVAKISEEEARKLFEDYKTSNLPLAKWSKSQGISSPTATGIFIRFFPGEYEDVIDVKMDRKTSNYARGRNFEWRVKKHYQKQGYWVLRSPQSRGLVDLVAIKKGEILMIQCKTSGDMSKTDEEELAKLSESVGARALLISRGGRRTVYELEFEQLYPRG